MSGYIVELKGRISGLLAIVERKMLGREWQEYDLRIEVTKHALNTGKG